MTQSRTVSERRDAVPVPGSEATEREQAARYVRDLTTGLSSIARRHQLDVLAYLLDMARLEAESHLK
jgi:hypothetical protein